MSAPDDSMNPQGGGGSTAGRGTPVPVQLGDGGRTLRTAAVLLAGPVLWSVHFMVVYLVVEAGCTGEGSGLRIFDPPVPTLVTLAATAVAAIACLVAAAVAYRLWRTGSGPVGRSLAFVGFLLSLLAVVQILFVGLPALALPAC